MRDENITISHSSFICIKSNVQNTHVRVLIFIAKNAKKFTCTSRSDIVNSEDMQAISIANNKIQREILLFNIYNEKSQNTDDEFFLYFFYIFFYFFIKCMQPMAMALSRRCMYAKLHVT